jgi:hypothetical protein
LRSCSREPSPYSGHSICLRAGWGSHQRFRLIVRVMGIRRAPAAG